MRNFPHPKPGIRSAFTLLEMLVSMVVLLILAMVVFSLTTATAKVWKGTTTKIDAFQGARTAFEAMTRNLSQATLNTYWDYFDANGNALNGGAIDHYGRNSELHFICGQAGYTAPGTVTSAASGLITSGSNSSGKTPSVRPAHAVFFVAPVGGSSDTSLQGLDKLLNALGYYVEFNDDSKIRPAFLRANTANIRYRFRLMEMSQATENLGIYNPNYAASKGIANYTKWYNAPITNGDVRPIAENIIALIIQPKRSVAETTDANGNKLQPLSPNYAYDSRNQDALKKPPTVNNLQRYQLPPLVQVTMVALDETSAQRLALKHNTTAPVFGSSSKDFLKDGFKTAPVPTESIPNPPNTDLTDLLGWLDSNHYTYRVFTSNVLIRGAKWSED